MQVRAAGINFPDLLMIRGQYQFRPPLPFTPGGESAGVVTAVGEGVERVQVGDSLIAMDLTGAFAESLVVAEEKTMPIPQGLSYAGGAAISITYGTSYYALKQQAKLKAGETLLVLGAAGGVGLAAVQLGALMGARVIAAASSEEKLDVASAAGATLRLNYSNLSPRELKEQIKTMSEGRGVDVVYDPVGGELSEAALRATAFDGRFLVVGFASGEIAKIPLNLALLKGAHIIGIFWGSWNERERRASAQNYAELRDFFGQGKLKPMVTSFPLEQFGDAFASLAQRQAKGKVVLEMTPE
jgi:NADPH2:quinone reductase